MKNRPVGAEMFHADRQKNMTKWLLTISGKGPRALILAS